MLGIFGKDKTPEHEKLKKQVEKLKKRRDVDALIKILENREDKLGFGGVRQAAAAALGDIGDPRAIEPLIAALNDRDHFAAGEANNALIRIGDERALEAIIHYAFSLSDYDYYRAVGKAIEIFPARKRVEILLRAIALEESPYINWKPGSLRLNAYRELSRMKDKSAVGPLIEMLKDERRRRSVVKTLGDIGDERAIGPLKQLLEDEDLLKKDHFLRSNVREALNKLGVT